ncbi:hypothetical protein AZE42_13961 [Rhizopogon vesiculosus]|uniref:RGS domain-containing protein n=1 Tax=Rhizopogon vesiculosus TaxID=180088 RepID=A0A1J8R7E5_9AGAM|nr:hypothetical protein AZE42_13961 [Rhizopogon vesiculosus]
MTRLSYFRRQIRKSPQARAFFQKSCEEEDLPTFDLLQWLSGP